MTPTIHDLLSLWAVKLARSKGVKFQETNKIKFYNQFHDKQHLKLYQQDIRAVLRREQVVDFINNLPTNSTIVDLGCGVGDILCCIKDRYFKLGLDFSLNSLHLVRHINRRLHLINASLYNLPLTDCSVDAAICLEVLEHLEEDDKALKEILRIIKEGGYLIISVPSHYYFKDYLRLIGHYRHYSREDLIKHLSKYQFKLVGYFNHYPRFNRLYLYLYWFLVVINLILRVILQDTKTIYERRLWSTSKLLYSQIILPILKRISKLDKLLKLEELDSSTFLLLRKFERKK